MAESAKLEPALGGGTYYFYPKPNPALTQILVGDRLKGVVYEYVARVTQNYLSRLWSRPHRNDDHVGTLEGTVRPDVYVGGFDHDRWVGTVEVLADYALADEWGRHSPAEGQNNSTYGGSHDLRDALYAEVPTRL